MNRAFLIALIDFLFALVAILFAVIIVLFSANHEISKGNITDKAEFVAVLEWNESSNSDVDLWMKNPLGNVIYFRNRDQGFTTLDRDDTGINDNSIISPTGSKIESTTRRETISVRSIIPGKFVVNVMLYSLRNPPPIHVKVQIIKLNPYSVVTERELDLTTEGQEQTVATFDVSPDGSVSDVDTNTEEKLSQELGNK